MGNGTAAPLKKHWPFLQEGPLVHLKPPLGL